MKILIALLMLVPAAILGALFGTVILGILPTMIGDLFVPDFHYSNGAHTWVRIAGLFGFFGSPVLVGAYLWGNSV